MRLKVDYSTVFGVWLGKKAALWTLFVQSKISLFHYFSCIFQLFNTTIPLCVISYYLKHFLSPSFTFASITIISKLFNKCNIRLPSDILSLIYKSQQDFTIFFSAFLLSNQLSTTKNDIDGCIMVIFVKGAKRERKKSH